MSAIEVFQTDVLVVGAGATGIMTARALAKKGRSVCLVEKYGAGAAQSNHSHGYMHRGHIYQRPTRRLVETLNQGADWWANEMDNLGINPVTVGSQVAFTSTRNADVACEAWAKSGLQFEPAGQTRGLQNQAFARVFATRERTYDFTPWFRHAVDQYTKEVYTVRGEVRSVGPPESGLARAVINAGNIEIEIRATAVVLCAGTSNYSILKSSFNHRGRTVNRMSYMMVVEADGLHDLSFVSPENDTYGLFLVSRSTEGEPRWLVSNYLSYGLKHPTPFCEQKWRIATMRTLKRYTDCLDPGRNPRWATYPAPKGELRRNVQLMNEHSLEQIGDSAVYVSAPSKLTLAPLLAEVTVANLGEHTEKPQNFPALDASGLRSEIPVCRERWMSTSTHSVGSISKPSLYGAIA